MHRSSIFGSYGSSIFVFWGTSILLSITVILIYIPTNSVSGLHFAHILASICYCCVLDDSHPNKSEWNLNEVFYLCFFYAFPLWPGILNNPIVSLFCNIQFSYKARCLCVTCLKWDKSLMLLHKVCSLEVFWNYKHHTHHSMTPASSGPPPAAAVLHLQG
jgi:hypothetical protein